ncbi:MAG TPA: hypothetical protein VK778_05725 [Solirubrobacteraceae bacterium]|jgi:hypothetical protein|nr:hypothetical protein [Solirubrobacteraceae bacterium]
MRSRLIPAALIALTALLLVIPSTASAAWGGEKQCYQGANGHCYAVDSWRMTGSEKVEGSELWDDTELMDVPEFGSGAFVDNEIWQGFEPKYWWAEVGQTAGGNGFYLEPENERYERNCCSLHSFWGFEGPHGFLDYSAPWTVNTNVNNVYQVNGTGHNGEWCVYFDQLQAWCETGFPEWSNDLEVGGEYYSNTRPQNQARDGVNGWWGGASHNWLKGVITTSTTQLWAKPNDLGDQLGNMEWGT